MDTIILADMDDWREFAQVNHDAIAEQYGTTDKAFRHLIDGGLVMGGGAAPEFHIAFAD